MIAAIINWSIKNRIAVLLATTFLIIAGLYSVKNTPVDAIPDLSDVQVIIKTNYVGQSPQVVQDQVTYPITTAMVSVPGAKTVRGFSFFGDSYVYVIFDEGTDVYWARSRVLEYLSQISSSLPVNVQPQLGPDATGVGWIYQYALVDKTGQHDLSELTSIQDWFLKFELQTVPGVSEIATVGGMVKQYQIQADPNKLRAFGVPLSHVAMALKQGNQETGASVIEMAEAEYMVTATGYITGLEDIRNTPIGINKNGISLTIKDIANVQLGPKMRRGIAELNGQGEVVGGIVVMRFEENAEATIKRVKEKLAQLQKGLPDGVEVVTVYDRSNLINEAVQTLWQKLVEEFIVVALVCLVFLFHIRSSLVALISLPVGILTAFIIMHLQGINANIMSLGGIAIAIGAMIDGAIVMVENMHKHLENNKITNENRWKIVSKSAVEVGPALFFSLLIITASFIPVFVLEAQEGKMFSPLAFTKTYAMAASAALAITLVPVLMGCFIRGKITPEHKNPVNRAFLAGYLPTLKLVLSYPKSTLAIAILLVGFTIIPLNKMGSEFMPPLDEGDLIYMPTTFSGISIGKARELLQQTDKLIKTVPEVKTVFGKIGRADTATDPAPLTMIETIIQLKPKSEWRDGVTLESLKKELNSLVQFPGVNNAWVMPIKTRIDMLATGIKTPVGLKIAGNDLSTIQSIGADLEVILNNVSGTASVYSERVAGGRYIKIDIDRVKAAQYGLNISEIHELISFAVGGKQVSTTVEGQARYPVNLRYLQDFRNSPEALSKLPIVTKNGAHIVLGDVSTIRIEQGPAGIKSENGRINGWVYVDIERTDLGSYVERAKLAVSEQLALPTGYSVTWSGQYEHLLRAKEKLTYIVPLTLTIIVLLLYLSFKRITEVMIILATLPLAMVGSIWFMSGLGFNFSVAVAVGFIALAGVAIEIGVIMLVYLNQSISNAKSDCEESNTEFNNAKLHDAIIKGAGLRIRPILMTTLSIIIGLLPVVYSKGTGSEIMSRIAAPMVGGMASALILTLLVLPAVFYLVKKE